MSGPVFPPGTVAVATVRGVEGVRVMRHETPNGERCWLSATVPQRGYAAHQDDDVTDVRPLVVLDLPQWALNTGQDWARVAEILGESKSMCARDIAEQIEEQTRDPKPAEPTGLGAVVEDSRFMQWIRYGDGPAAWMLAGASPGNRDTVPYDSIDVTRVLSSGVPS